jgi:signal transduction histidine kinase
VTEKINLGKLFDEVMQSMTVQENVQENAVHLLFEHNNNSIIGQADLIKSLLLNLCNNALKASASGGVIEVEATRKQKHVVITVTDNGCGIPQEDLQKIFEPFYRIDKSRNRILASGGVGLGLTLCRRIAEVHNAQINIKSQVGTGTTVEIIFTTS